MEVTALMMVMGDCVTVECLIKGGDGVGGDWVMAAGHKEMDCDGCVSY